MRWSIIRLIWFRELRDQLRDRRTVFMIVILPVLVYPLAGFGMLAMAPSFFSRPNVVGIAGLDAILPWTPGGRQADAARATGWIAAAPATPGVGPICAAASFHLAPFDLPPPILHDGSGGLSIPSRYLAPGVGIRLTALPGPAPTVLGDIARSPLDGRRVDAILAFPPNFQDRLQEGERPPVFVLARESDESSRLARTRVVAALERWNDELRSARLARRGLPADFAEAFHLVDSRPAASGTAGRAMIAATVARVFPFILVLWVLAGALGPAVDLCAGEKERGTMETLLISPASRDEIVYGKFLTIWVFSATAALLNLASMALTTWWLSSTAAPLAGFRPAALFWAVVLLMPLSAFFSALCLAVGAFARSSKEGQFYLMPLLLATMPLLGLSLAPGVELNPFYCMVPLTGVALLLQRLVAASADSTAWAYMLPVLIPMVVYSWLALRWAVAQFRSEQVLFREAARLDLGLWVRRLLREKEPWPSPGEAFACFAVILVLRWLSLGFGTPWVRAGVTQLAFVAAPALIMAVMLTTSPARGLGLRPPPAWSWPVALILGMATLPPLAELAFAVLRRYPALLGMLQASHPLARELMSREGTAPEWLLFLVTALLPAVCEELAFRGFILTGLLRGFRPFTAVLLSSFLFALSQMNAFQFVPSFLLGVVLGVVTVRTGSVLPAMLLHLAHSGLLLVPGLLPELADPPGSGRLMLLLACLVMVVMSLVAAWRLPTRAGETG